MAAAYAALVSLMHTINQIEHHPRPPISLDNEQVESLAEKVTFLLEFLEGYSHVGYTKEADGLARRIADAAYAAEDVIESRMVDQILAGSTSHGEEISSIDFYQDLQKVIEDMDSVKKEVMDIKEPMEVPDQLQRSSASTGSLRSSSTRENITMVGADDVLLEMKYRLTDFRYGLEIIPIVGMGGIGKTTLARNIYANPLICEHFDICAWATVSQEGNTRDILREVLCQVTSVGWDDSSKMSLSELGDTLLKHLRRKRYLIVMDDMWSIKLWNGIKILFPDDNNRSRIIVTTRLSKLAKQLNGFDFLQMKLLDADKSWDLFCTTVFGTEGCRLELEEIGRKVVENCKGLPLSIVSIGGQLAKSKHTREYWEYIADPNSAVNLKSKKRSLEILRKSYNELPIYLKPCFLHVGVFLEGNVISFSTLVKLWVAEGFIKPIWDKSLEETAREYIMELIDTSLISVHEFGSTGNIKYCNIHDLVREFCLREAQKERFYNIIGQHSLNLPQGVNTKRRIAIPKSTSEEKVLNALHSMSLARSLICDIDQVLPSVNFKLLRILKMYDKCIVSPRCQYFLENLFQLVNSRYLEVEAHLDSKFPSSIYLLWNLQSLIVHNYEGIAPIEIWSMAQLRYVEFKKLHLPDPPNHVGGQDDIVLGNLQTLLTIKNLKCHEEVIKRIPNIKKLNIEYTEIEGRSCYYLDNLGHLHKLESFGCRFSPKTLEPIGSDFLQNLTFPASLKKLTIGGGHVHWEDMLIKIGSLPNLQKLKLIGGSFRGCKWETIEGHFCSLKFLLIDSCGDLKYWKTDSMHFPRLEHLVLRDLHELEEIPLDIGEILTLRSIDLTCCSNSAIFSAKRILEEQEEYGNDDLEIRIEVKEYDDELQSLASRNFQVEFR